MHSVVRAQPTNLVLTRCLFPACRLLVYRQLTAVLPSLDPVPTQELPDLAHLHLNSAGHLMATIKLLVPHAFQDSATEPNLAALLPVSGPAAGMVSTLIELQLFHLTRAKDVTAHMRARIAHRRSAVQRQMQSLVTTSSSCADDEMVQSLE
jgi:hypothetical protein